MSFTVDDLDDLVAKASTELGLGHPDVLALLPIDLQYSTVVDQSLDPFSPEYFAQQLELYAEIAGRPLHQESGELHPVDVDALARHPNALGVGDVAFISDHLRSLSTMVSVACLRPHARVLDMGAGHGLASEVFATCGCEVHAVDIDPGSTELGLRRARERGLPIERSMLNYDDVATLPVGGFDAAFFFQSLHHCLQPWRLIGDLAGKLSDDAVIAFTGEPMQTHWWRHWGLRLDTESLYVARRYGWFESGWSHEFIRECFARNGFELRIFVIGGESGREIGVAARVPARLEPVVERARVLGLPELGRPGHELVGFLSEIGLRTVESVMATRPGHTGGYLCFGPYKPARAGRYVAEIRCEHVDGGSDTVLFDIASRQGMQVHLAQRLTVRTGDSRSFRFEFRLPTDAVDIELRLRVNDGGQWTCTEPTLVRSGS